MTPAKPFLKWAGGKRQLLAAFDALYPYALKQGKIKHYYEPFLGSGAVFFDVMQRYSLHHAYLYDSNEDLMLTYRILQQKVAPLLERLQQKQEHFYSLSATERTDFYYAQRQSYNDNQDGFRYNNLRAPQVERAAQFIFLNRTCFNGLYRVNAAGHFNTPMGRYVHPVICDTDNLLAVHQLLQRATLGVADFSQLLQAVRPASFVYLDPPYRPLTQTAAFNAYQAAAFTDEEQTRLAAMFRALHQKKGWVMLSNSDPKNVDPEDNFFDHLYAGFEITRVAARRMINADATKRGAIHEVVVRNYVT